MTSNTLSASGIGSAAAPRNTRSLLWVAVLIFALGAMFTSGYLSYGELTRTPAACSNEGFVNCDAVRASVWSKLFGIPVSYLGFIWYTTIASILLLEKRVSFFRQYGVYIVFGMSLWGFMFHCYLSYNSIFVLQKICPWCLTTHAFMTCILILNTIRMVRTMNARAAAAGPQGAAA
jgi:uncharacterized membrane protein